jgi:hypothetical protein
VIAKLKEAGVEIKSEEEIRNLRLAAEQMMFDDSDDEDDSEDSQAEHVPRELGARTNEVKDLGGMWLFSVICCWSYSD